MKTENVELKAAGFNELFEKAKWIRPSAMCADTCFKGTFTADSAVKTTITICGLGFYKLFINGRRVGCDELAPVTSFYHHRKELYCRDRFGEKLRSRIYVEKHDISEYVKEGTNEIEVLCGLGWYYQFGDTPVLVYEIINGKNRAASDENVLWAKGPVTETNFCRYEYQDYISGSFDQNNIALDGYEKSVLADIPETKYYVSSCPNDKVIRTITPKLIAEADGYNIYDAGENITGVYVFTCSERGKSVEVTVSEALSEERTDGTCTHTDLSEKYTQGQVSRFITDGTEREYRLLHTWAAFRYLKLPAGATLKRIDVIHADVKVSSSFECKNEVLNWIYRTFIRTQLCNMHAGLPSDCPHIERRGYTGDGQLVCPTALMTLEASAFYKKWMEDISDCQDEISGHVQYTAPYHNCGGGPGGWGSAIAMVPYAWYCRYNDIEPMKKYFTQALHYLDYLEAHSENDLVVSDQPGLWCLGDWCTPHEVHAQKPDIPEPFVNTYFYIRTIDVLIETAQQLALSESGEQKAERLKCIASLYEVRARKVKALTEKYYDGSTGCFAGNLNSANAFALDIGLGDKRTLAELVRHVREDVMDLGIFGLEICTRVLCEKGYVSDVIELLARREYPSFGYMMESGATTLWEEWKNPRSMSHPMFGAPVKLFFRYILGIRQPKGAYGMQKLTIAPFVNEVTGDASGSLITEEGTVSVSTDIASGTYTVSLPEGVHASCKNGNGYTQVTEQGVFTFEL